MSVKLTVVLLLSIALTSIVGTIIPQNQNPADYFRAYGEYLYRLFDVLDVFDMYHSWWFQFLLLLLTMNIIVCSIDRLSATWKMVFAKNPSFNLSRFRKLSQKGEFNASYPPNELIKRYEPYISKRFGYTRIEETEKGLCIFAEKWRWTRLGVYTVHLSVILMLLGGLMGSIFGFQGYVNIPEGEKIDSVRAGNTGKIQHLGFEIKCEDFDVSFYKNGAPKEYRSSLTIIEKGHPVYKKDIIVNDPLRYKGYNIFQSGYGKMASNTASKKKVPHEKPLDEIMLNFAGSQSGKSYRIKTVIGKPVDIPEGLGKFVVVEYRKTAEFVGQNIGDAYVGILTPSGEKPVEVLLPLHFPNFDRMRKGSVFISVADQTAEKFNPGEQTGFRYYTGLQVTKDPGVLVVYTGFIVIIIGCFITFFMSHQRACIEIIKGKTNSKIIVTGTANKNKMGMQQKVKKLSDQLADLSHRS
ncbi:MAG: cytochrome c biogenesis protein ResB [Deltaproteobacteria bacterium]|nr:cytochrome c biogenesis protein ResB [Deltaproteobacteria bacterium]